MFDIESMSRIAQIDRPTGARSSLYPTISSLRPSLLFERSDSLLIGWGDCLMALLVRDVQSSKTSSKDGAPAKEVKRKSVTVTMAWELDCVACSVVPVDDKHVAVLGLAPSPSVSSDADDPDEIAKASSPSDHSVAGGDNLLEVSANTSRATYPVPLSSTAHHISPSPTMLASNNQSRRRKIDIQ